MMKLYYCKLKKTHDVVIIRLIYKILKKIMSCHFGSHCKDINQMPGNRNWHFLYKTHFLDTAIFAIFMDTVQNVFNYLP